MAMPFYVSPEQVMKDRGQAQTGGLDHADHAPRCAMEGRRS
jgi:hypothetical protein